MSDPEPVTFRPRRLRILIAVASVSLCALSLFGWFALPPGLRAQFSLSQIVTLLGVLALLVAIMAVIASSYVRADADGLTIRNGLATHRVPWAKVHTVLLRPGDPWALVLIVPDDRPFEVTLDAEKKQLMGVLATDGEPALEAVRTLRWMQRHYAGPRPDGPDGATGSRET